MNPNLFTNTLHGLQAFASTKVMAWMLIRDKCRELKLKVPTLDKVNVMKENALNIEFKRHRTNTWELRARAAIRDNASMAPDVSSFVRGFNYDLKNMSLDSYNHISNAYKAVEVDSNTAHVNWTNHVKNDGKDITIAVITKNDQQRTNNDEKKSKRSSIRLPI